MVCINFVNSQEDTQQKLDEVLEKADLAESKRLDIKITEMRNIMWEEVDPVIRTIVDEIENNIEIIKYLNIYDFEEINLSHGDIKKGIALFDRTKIDSSYSINEMDFEKKIKDTKDVVKNLKKVSLLIPEVEVQYSIINEKYNITDDEVDKFSIKVRDVDNYKNLKRMNLTYIRTNLEFKKDEVKYMFTNEDEHNLSIEVKAINKKIVAKNNLRGIEMYELFDEDLNSSKVLFKTPHSFMETQNTVLIHKGNLPKDTIIPINYVLKLNRTEFVSMTLIMYDKYQILPDEEEESYKKNEEKKDIQDYAELEEKQNNFPYIILCALIIIFLVLILGSFVSQNKIAKDLNEYRRKINNLKKNF
jgi:hypothetical protein